LQLLVTVIFGSLAMSVPRYFEYHLAHCRFVCLSVCLSHFCWMNKIMKGRKEEWMNEWMNESGLVSNQSWQLPWFEYHLAHRTENGTQILQVSKNEQLLGSRTYVIGYRIVLSFLVIYVIPMTTLTSFQLVFLCRRQQLYQYINTRSSATAERQRVIYVIPMTTLVALNGRILAALWRASRGPVALAARLHLILYRTIGLTDYIGPITYSPWIR